MIVRGGLGIAIHHVMDTLLLNIPLGIKSFQFQYLQFDRGGAAKLVH